MICNKYLHFILLNFFLSLILTNSEIFRGALFLNSHISRPVLRPVLCEIKFKINPICSLLVYSQQDCESPNLMYAFLSISSPQISISPNDNKIPTAIRICKKFAEFEESFDSWFLWTLYPDRLPVRMLVKYLRFICIYRRVDLKPLW